MESSLHISDRLILTGGNWVTLEKYIKVQSESSFKAAAPKWAETQSKAKAGLSQHSLKSWNPTNTKKITLKDTEIILFTALIEDRLHECIQDSISNSFELSEIKFISLSQTMYHKNYAFEILKTKERR